MSKITVHEKASYLADFVFAASDGIATTFAIVAGSAGAELSRNVVLILGFANLFADGFSMAAGLYLGVKSEIEYEKSKGERNIREGIPLRHGIVSLLAFSLAGFVPIFPFVFKISSPFEISALLVGVSLFALGFLKSLYTKRNFLKSGLETFLVGGLAALVAFLIGFFVEKVVL